jgi:uncharacterized membrane protein
MTLAPLFAASPVIQIHAVAASAAFVLGLIQFLAPKGTLPHRTLGWIWVGLMLIVSGTAFFIHSIRLWGPFSPIHLLAIFTPVMLFVAVVRARRHQANAHKWSMVGIFIGALVVAGGFSFLPGRVMNAVATGVP